MIKTKPIVRYVGAAVLAVTCAVTAEEKAVVTPVLTQLSSTTIGGYIDTSAYWNPGTGNANPAPFGLNAGKQDGFNLDSVLLTISKPLDEGTWSSGYELDLQFGPDAAFVGIDPHIRQAYVALRAPVGNGLDIQIGRWDTLVGFEANDNYKNPNFTHSYAWSFAPTEHDGVLTSYKVSDLLSVKAGVANTYNTAGINARNRSATGSTTIESQKSYMAALNLTAPDSTGFLKGSSLNLIGVHGPTTFGTEQVDHVSANATIATPLEGLRLGAEYNILFNSPAGHTWAAALYASIRPSPESKLSFHARGEYYHGPMANLPASLAQVITTPNAHLWEATGTIQYDLWQNVISRLEVRWDHSDNGPVFGGTGAFAAPSKKNDVTVAANIIYKF